MTRERFLVPGGRFALVVILLAVVGCGRTPSSTPERVELRHSSRALGGPADFVVTALDGPTSTGPGNGINLSVTVCNQGEAGDSTGVDLFLSTDSTIEPSDTFLSSVMPPYLGPGQCAVRVVYGVVSVPAGAYYLGAIADVAGQVSEADETNNVRVGDQIGVGFGPDFVVTEVEAPSSAPGSFVGKVTVCNRGNASGGTEVNLFVSTDSTITPADEPAGSFYTPGLEPGQCASLDAFFSPAGPLNGSYYAGAIADGQNQWVELIETNNDRASKLMGLGWGPDLVVTDLASPVSIQSGSGFNAIATVCNQGTSWAGATVELRLSSDAVASPDDHVAATGGVSSLPEGRCALVNLSGWVSLPDGPYHLIGVVDPGSSVSELIESNNTRTGDVVGVGYAPDFVVAEVSGPPNAHSWNGFIVTVTVCNQGMAFGSTNVDLFLSPDSNITVSDAFIGSVYPGTLAPGECTTRAVNVSAGVSDGNYHLGAIADPQGMEYETNESNNVKLGAQLGVGYAPDFVVTEVSGPASAQPGSGFTASVTVCNRGNSGGATNVNLYLSADEKITPIDFDLGMSSTPTLYQGQCSTLSIPVGVNTGAGVYVLGAIADPGNGLYELNESNNAKAGGRMGVGSNPDLYVSEVSGPVSVTNGGSITAPVTVCNQGTAWSPGAMVEVRLSADTAITVGDSMVGSTWVNDLSPGQCSTVSVAGAAGVSEGNWYIGAIVDPGHAVAELLESNNAKAGGQMGVGYAPDLVVSAVSGPVSVVGGGNLTVPVTVCNQGTAWSSNTSVELRLSADAAITTLDFHVGSIPVDGLSPGQCSAVTVSGWATFPEGTYYLGAIVDSWDGIFELNESNNAKVGGQMGVGSKPDLVVSEVSGPASVTQGGSLTAVVTVCNQGTAPTPIGEVEVRFSSDTAITMDDLFLGYASAGGLSPGQCATVSVSGNAYVPDGVYYLGAIIDPANMADEFFEGNNTKAGGQVGVGSNPDLVVSEVSGPASVMNGGSFTTQVRVCNQGTMGSPPSNMDVFLSTDATITQGDTMVGGAPVSGLAVGQCATVSVNGSAFVPEGVYYMGAIADLGNTVFELNESNNTKTGGQMGVGNKVDLQVSEVSGPPSVMNGGSFTATVTVCNQGTVPSMSNSVDVRLSADTTIGMDDALVGSGMVNGLSPGQCATVSVSGSAYGPNGVYYLGARADPYDMENEFFEGNNTKVGGQVGVGSNPDLVVSEVSGPASVTNGGSFTAQVRVCNQGTMWSPSSNVDVFLSTDATIAQNDIMVGGVPVSGLSPGQCATMSMSGSAYVPEGVYYVGAIADISNMVLELNESNNAKAGGQMGVGSKPDLYVSEVSGPASVVNGGNLTAVVTVCNQGTAPTPMGHVEVRFSTDTTFTMDDFFLGYASAGGLSPGQCATVSVSGYAYMPDGVYYLGAIVDPGHGEDEFFEGNNTKAGGQVGVGSNPDLVVSELSGPASVMHGGSFTARVTVCNQGTTWSPPTNVDVFLSGDATITLSDIMVGGAPVNGLSPGQCAPVTVMGYAYVPDGLYYVGAIADLGNTVFELNESNNVKTGGQMGVGDKVDLYVSAVTGPPSVTNGGSFTAQVTVCNQGTRPSMSNWVEVRFSMDGAFTMDDPFVGGGSVNGLSPGQCATVSVNGNAYALDGLYYLGAVVDPGNGEDEFFEGNNAKAGDQVGVGSNPDLVVSAVSGPAGVMNGGSFTAQVTVCNQGTMWSPSSHVDIFLSTDATITLSDAAVGGAPVNDLSPGQCVTVSVSGNAYAPDGVYYLGTIADISNMASELNESNNAKAGGQMGVGSKPDLYVSEVNGPASVTNGGSLTANVTVCNQGTVPTPMGHVEVRLSTDTTITMDDPFLGYASAGGLSPGQCATVSVSGNAYAPDGVYYLVAVADPGNGEDEFFENNNTKVGGQVGVGSNPDLVVSAVSGPASVMNGGSFTAQVTVCNQGTMWSPSSNVDVFLSTDATITQGDLMVGGAPVNGLAVGQCATVSVNGSAYVPDGVYYMGAIGVLGNTVIELNESNNMKAGGQLGVGNKVDLYVSEVSGPASVMNGGSFTANVTVCNQGTRPSASSWVEARFSTDSTLTKDDAFLGGAPVNGLAVGQCATVSVSGNAYVPDGLYYLGAVVDPVNMEDDFFEGNNAKAGGQVGVGSNPDLYVSAVSGPASVMNGGSFTAQVTVCNQGTTTGPPPHVDIFLSTDATITQSDTMVGGAPVNGILPPGQCATVSVSGNAYLPDGVYYVGVIADISNMVSELNEGNNTKAGGQMGVGSKPDLYVSEVSGPASVMNGGSLTAVVTVCNQGTAPSPGHVEVRFSTDATFTMDDPFLGYASAGGLPPGQCATVSVSGNAYVPDGVYYLLAVIDPGNGENEFFEDNNTKVGGQVGVGSNPDLHVSAVSGPASVMNGGSFTAQVTVCNQGTTGTGGSVEVEVRLSTDTTITASDFFVGSTPAGGVPPGQCKTVDVTGPANVPSGTYYVGATADPANWMVELIESNNTRAGNTVNVGP